VDIDGNTPFPALLFPLLPFLTSLLEKFANPRKDRFLEKLFEKIDFRNP
jgi:hypothetical protein